MGVIMMYLAGILLLALLSPTYGDPVDRCYNYSTTYDQSLIIRNISDVWSEKTCQGHCYDDPGCVAFTHWYMADICSLFSNTSTPVSCDYCQSGPKECNMCSQRNTTCTQGLLDILFNTPTETYCQQRCYSRPECSTYTWFTPSHPDISRECHLYSSCDNTTPCKECVTGPDDCAKCFPPEDIENSVWDCRINDKCYLRCDPGFVPITPKNRPNYCSEGVWHSPPESVSCTPGVALLSGGAGLATTEAYSSTSTCSIKLPDHEHTLTGHTMEYIGGVPVTCGGVIGDESTASNKCWVLEDDQAGVKEWRESEHSLQQQRSFGSIIEGYGDMRLIGGEPNANSTEYLSPGGEWVLGFYLAEPFAHGCVARLSWNSFLVINAAAAPAWNISTVTKYFLDGRPEEQLPNLKTPRESFACSLVKNETFTGVLVAGGKTKGDVLNSSELFNLEVGEWMEAGSLNFPRLDFKMLALEGGIHAFGGFYERTLNSVEKFNLSTGEWEIAGNLSEPRKAYAVALVPAEQFCGDEITTTTTPSSTTATTTTTSNSTTTTSNSTTATTTTTTTSNSTTATTTTTSNSTVLESPLLILLFTCFLFRFS